MDKLLAVEEFFFDLPAPAAANIAEKVDFEVNPEKYREFLRINPIWSYIGLSKEEYFRLSIQEKSSHIHKYYKHMLNGKKRLFLLFLFDFLMILDLIKVRGFYLGIYSYFFS